MAGSHCWAACRYGRLTLLGGLSVWAAHIAGRPVGMAGSHCWPACRYGRLTLLGGLSVWPAHIAGRPVGMAGSHCWAAFRYGRLTLLGGLSVWPAHIAGRPQFARRSCQQIAAGGSARINHCSCFLSHQGMVGNTRHAV